ncbi:MAG: 50S ribosomal protein L2 [Thermoproteus sp. AZ2]|uniref:50S ribosomal protein L2 n=1 Tax=Thermoproteus sp. AZ2 TaxID=1609232 RepID=A0ACC6UZR3_9CREN|nr:MAG: 50S ribosomal protein L2 [Thermoproteus sp. AZ2]
MGKRILVQRRGRGGSQFRSPSWKRDGPVRYPPAISGYGYVIELLHEPGLNAPVARIRMSDGTEFFNYAAEGMYVGQRIEVGENASVKPGNVLPLNKLPEGTMVFNVEKLPGDGGKYARSGGSYAVVLTHRLDVGKTSIRLPSGRVIDVDSRARATVGIVAGGGRIEKPMLKAGAKYYRARAKAWKWPTVRGKAMSAYAHPHGGGSHPKGGTPVPRTAPPGQKVGFIASRCTGRGCRRAKAQQKI